MHHRKSDIAPNYIPLLLAIQLMPWNIKLKKYTKKCCHKTICIQVRYYAHHLGLEKDGLSLELNGVNGNIIRINCTSKFPRTSE